MQRFLVVLSAATLLAVIASPVTATWSTGAGGNQRSRFVGPQNIGTISTTPHTIGTSDYYYGEPVLHNGIAYSAWQSDYDNSTHTYIVAMRLSDRKQLWKSAIPGSDPYASARPAIDPASGDVFATGATNQSGTGQLIVVNFDMSNGTIKWLNMGLPQALTPANGAVIGPTMIYLPSFDSTTMHCKLNALSRATGELLHTATHSGYDCSSIAGGSSAHVLFQAGGAGSGQPTRTVFFEAFNGKLEKLWSANYTGTGKISAQFTPPTMVYAQEAGIVFGVLWYAVGNPYGLDYTFLIAFNASTGAQVWTKQWPVKTEADGFRAPATDGLSKLWLAMPFGSGNNIVKSRPCVVLEMDVSTGTNTKNFTSDNLAHISSVVVAADKLVVISPMSSLFHVFDRATSTETTVDLPAYQELSNFPTTTYDHGWLVINSDSSAGQYVFKTTP